MVFDLNLNDGIIRQQVALRFHVQPCTAEFDINRGIEKSCEIKDYFSGNEAIKVLSFCLRTCLDNIKVK